LAVISLLRQNSAKPNIS